MVQALLADRFRLVAHLETRELPIYVLVVAKGGPKLGAVRETGSWVNTGNGRIEVQMQNSVAVLAEALSQVAGREVVDKAGGLPGQKYIDSSAWQASGSLSSRRTLRGRANRNGRLFVGQLA